MNSSKKLLTRVAAFVGVSLGAFALAAVAGTWTPPTSTAPNGNVDAPINVGSTAQMKEGALGIGRTPTTGYKFDVMGSGWIDAIGANSAIVTNNVTVGSLTIKNATKNTVLKVSDNGAVVPGSISINVGSADSASGTRSSCPAGMVVVGIAVKLNGAGGSSWVPTCASLTVK